MSTASLDFADIKRQVPIERVAREMLNLKLSGNGDQLRGQCPITNSSDPRSFVITTSKGVFYSFKAKKGGDMFTLVARVNDCDLRKAAEMIATHFGVSGNASRRGSNDSSPHNPAPRMVQRPAFDPDKYAATLDAAHAALEPLGISSETFVAWRAGYAPSGVLRGKLALPVASKDGIVVGYVGRTLKEETPALQFPNGLTPTEHIFAADRVKAGELFLVRDPLDVLKAFEGGITNTVSFLTETISAQQLEMLVVLMDERQCHELVLF